MTKTNSTENKAREWPGNNLSFLNMADREMHDHLCELLHEMKYSEMDVCTASVGIWGALVVMRMKMNLVVLECQAKDSTIINLKEQIETNSETLSIFNKNVSELNKWKGMAEKLAAVLEHAIHNEYLTAGSTHFWAMTELEEFNKLAGA